MTDYSELKRLAEEATIGDKPASTPISELIRAKDAFRAGCSPAVVLALIADIDQLKAENELMRHQLAACAKELRAASGWICREVEAGTKSATHWAIRLKTNADQVDGAIGKGEQT